MQANLISAMRSMLAAACALCTTPSWTKGKQEQAWHELRPDAPHPAQLMFVTKPFAPYVYDGPDGRAAGPLVDVLASICASNGWHCAVRVLPWRRALRMALDGKADGIFPVVNSSSRRQSFRLSPVVVKARYVLVAHPAAAPKIRAGHLDLTGRTLAAYGPSEASASLESLVQGQTGTHAEIELDHQTVLRKLIAGRYGTQGVALMDEAVARQLLATSGLNDLKPSVVVRELDYAFALAPQRMTAAQSSAFDVALRGLCDSGRLAAMLRPRGLVAARCGPEHLKPEQTLLAVN